MEEQTFSKEQLQYLSNIINSKEFKELSKTDTTKSKDIYDVEEIRKNVKNDIENKIERNVKYFTKRIKQLIQEQELYGTDEDIEVTERVYSDCSLDIKGELQIAKRVHSNLNDLGFYSELWHGSCNGGPAGYIITARIVPQQNHNNWIKRIFE